MKENKELWLNFHGDKCGGTWHDGHEEPDASLDAWIIIQIGDDSYETVKYAGYDTDYMTWEQNRDIIRWMYLPI